MINLPKFISLIGINNIPQNLTLDKLNIFLNLTIENYFKDQTFIPDTISNFCSFLGKEGYTIDKSNTNKELNNVNDINQDFTKKRNKHILNCPHIERKHYAKVIIV